MWGIDVEGVNMKRVDMGGVDMKEVDIKRVDMGEVDMREVDMRSWYGNQYGEFDMNINMKNHDFETILKCMLFSNRYEKYSNIYNIWYILYNFTFF